MEWKETGDGSDYEQIEPGTYSAVCYKIVDLGTQLDEYEGKQLKRHRVLIAWEVEQFMTDGRPFAVSSFYTQSLHEKAKLRLHLESWRGRAFTPDELKGFDPRKLLGAPCLLSLVLNTRNKTKVNAVLKLTKGTTPPLPVNKHVFFSLDKDKFDQAIFDTFSDNIKKMIAQSPEYISLFDKKAPSKDPAEPTDAELAAHAAKEIADDIPF